MGSVTRVAPGPVSTLDAGATRVSGIGMMPRRRIRLVWRPYNSRLQRTARALRARPAAEPQGRYADYCIAPAGIGPGMANTQVLDPWRSFEVQTY